MTPLAVNESATFAAFNVQAMIPALSPQWKGDLQSAWGVGAASSTFVPKGKSPTAPSCWIVFLDDSDEAAAPAYHDLTNERLPTSNAFASRFKPTNRALSPTRVTNCAKWLLIPGSGQSQVRSDSWLDARMSP